MKRFRGGLVFEAHRLLYHSTLGSKVIQKKKKVHLQDGRLRAREQQAPCMPFPLSPLVPDRQRDHAPRRDDGLEQAAAVFVQGDCVRL